MDEKDAIQMEQLLKSVPGGIAKLVFDDVLTILYATDTFNNLIKNATEKIITKAPMALLRIVYSADIIYVTQQLAVQKHRKDNLISLNFRTLQQDGSFRWVMITGSRTEEEYTSGTKSLPVYSCIAVDVTDHMLKYKKLEQINEYQRTITELSKELYFEYEIAKDTLAFTELFREVFGRDAEITNFRTRLERSKIIHPEELPIVISIFNNMMSGKKQVRFEVRLISKDGVATWYVCYASIIYDENRNPFKLIGKLSTTNPIKKEADMPSTEPQFDTLTKVYTKESAESIITEVMSKQEPEALSALMVIDIRNYKGINEIMKAANGEDILTTIADLFKIRFRATDIIGRLALSDFVIYVKGIRTDKNVYEKAEQLCKEVDNLYSFAYTKNSLSISIGIAFHRGALMEYPVLLANSKTALIMAKKIPTSSFEVFYTSTAI